MKSGAPRTASRQERWLTAALTVALLAAVALSAVVVAHPQPFAWEVTLTRSVQRQAWLCLPLQAISWPGNSVLAQGSCLLLACGLLARHGWAQEARALAYVGVGAFLWNIALKALVGRSRPTGEIVQLHVAANGWSFPSGHVMFYTAFYGGMALFAQSKLSPSVKRASLIALCATLVGLAGVSRVFLGAHWPTDVAAGYGYGLAWLLLIGRPLWQANPQGGAPGLAESDLAPSGAAAAQATERSGYV
ncbi:MAG: hypothetical protein CFK52_04120 [Chloracidobacterium sp. CP2_5A]|nr:MAG: hypothetical protein CFK52_04120 [Chloracidobacterium sp. CP2_5A]